MDDAIAKLLCILCRYLGLAVASHAFFNHARSEILFCTVGTTYACSGIHNCTVLKLQEGAYLSTRSCGVRSLSQHTKQLTGRSGRRCRHQRRVPSAMVRHNTTHPRRKRSGLPSTFVSYLRLRLTGRHHRSASPTLPLYAGKSGGGSGKPTVWS